MRYIIYVEYKQEFLNSGEASMPCPFCGGEIPPDYMHRCEHKKPIEVDVPGEVYHVSFEKN